MAKALWAPFAGKRGRLVSVLGGARSHGAADRGLKPGVEIQKKKAPHGEAL